MLPRLVCWLLHRAIWNVLVPGVLPWSLDAIAYCPSCDSARGRRAVVLIRVPVRRNFR